MYCITKSFKTSTPRVAYKTKFSVIQLLTRRTAPFGAFTQRGVVFPYRRFGTTYLSYLQWSRIKEDSRESKVFNEGRK
jgi:hypothetical protein